MIEGADKIQKGDLAHRIPIIRKDEIGILADSFNAMAEELQKTAVSKDALTEEKQRFMALAEQAPFGMALIDNNGCYKYINTKFKDIFGYSLNDIPTGRDWFKNAYPDPRYRSHVIRTWLEDFKISLPGEKIPRIFTVTCKDGTEKIVHILSTILDTGEYLITYEDITEQKRTEGALRNAEEKYRKIFQDTPEGIFQATLDGRLISANPAFARVLRYDSSEELVNSVTDIWEQLYPDPLMRQEFTRNIFEKEEMRNVETQALQKDGESVWLSINARLVRGKGGKPQYCEGTLEDIGMRKKFEAGLRQAHKMEAIGTLAGGIAHDFNNLLTGIQGYTSLMLLNKSPAHPDYDKLKKIEQQVNSAANLTKQLLGFARKGRYDIKLVDLNEVLERSSNAFGRTREEISIEQVFQEDLWVVEADQGQIEHMLINLYMNASDAMPGGGTLNLETANVVLDESHVRPFSMKPGNYVRITVVDTGIGMDEKTRQRIFEPFFTTKEMGRGIGLGLASVYGTVKGHGGIINVSSEKGSGTTFTIYLPATAKDIIKENAGDKTGIIKESKTVLLVYDEETIIDISKQILEALGYNILVAKSGREAINIYRQHYKYIKVVILDIVASDSMSGRQTLDALWTINPVVKLILSDGYSMNDVSTKITEQGHYVFIRKPFGIDQLSEKLKEVLNG